jgi:hypothetical protein
MAMIFQTSNAGMTPYRLAQVLRPKKKPLGINRGALISA